VNVNPTQLTFEISSQKAPGLPLKKVLMSFGFLCELLCPLWQKDFRLPAVSATMAALQPKPNKYGNLHEQS
jgi:hypothetical protein